MIRNQYDYPERVRFELTEEELPSYERAAEFLNFTNVDLVCVQHEYGIFGGTAGSHILELLRKLRVPVVTTLHTVLREPNPDQHRVMVELAELSDRLIVMSQHSSQFLQEIFQVPRQRLTSFRMESPIWRLSIRIFTRTGSELEANPYC